MNAPRRPPHGGRGLKSFIKDISAELEASPSPRRAWIEISLRAVQHLPIRSPSPRRAWIEIHHSHPLPLRPPSPSPRRAWIEMCSVLSLFFSRKSRPPHGGRGLKWYQGAQINISNCRPPHGGRGLKWSCLLMKPVLFGSPSPRRAWIEIRLSPASAVLRLVALPTEGVD